MKRQIRIGTFETNSSSVHSLCMVNEDGYNNWINGKCYFHRLNETFLTKEQVKEMLIEHEPEIYTFDDDLLALTMVDYRIYSYEDYLNEYSDYEMFSKSYKSESGDRIVGFGYFGEDN